MSSKTIWDKHGNRIGEDVIPTNRDGLIHIAHYNSHNSLVGRSTVERDWWGDYYIKTEEMDRFRQEHREKAKEEREATDGKSDASAVLRWAIIGPFAYHWLLGKKKAEKNNPHPPYDLPLWQCPTCGKKIYTAGRFCSGCGTERSE